MIQLLMPAWFLLVTLRFAPATTLLRSLAPASAPRAAFQTSGKPTCRCLFLHLGCWAGRTEIGAYRLTRGHGMRMLACWGLVEGLIVTLALWQTLRVQSLARLCYVPCVLIWPLLAKNKKQLWSGATAQHGCSTWQLLLYQERWRSCRASSRCCICDAGRIAVLSTESGSSAKAAGKHFAHQQAYQRLLGLPRARCARTLQRVGK